MEEERLWKFRKPEWMNSAWVRNTGVYGAGALVRLPPSVQMPSHNFALPAPLLGQLNTFCFGCVVW